MLMYGTPVLSGPQTVKFDRALTSGQSSRLAAKQKKAKISNRNLEDQMTITPRVRDEGYDAIGPLGDGRTHD
jgi:hypothetical protein